MSGGERKRVTIAEMIVGGRRALFLDEISTGLDSATLFSIISIMRRYTHGGCGKECGKECGKATEVVSW